MGNPDSELGTAALSSSVWLVCRKRPETARPGWDNQVLEEMRGRSPRACATSGTPAFAGRTLSGPPPARRWRHTASTRWSRRPTSRAQVMTVSEFLRQVRRIVVDFVVGRVLSGNGDGDDARAGRCHHLLPAAPPRLRPGRCARRGLHPLCHLLQPVGQRLADRYDHPGAGTRRRRRNEESEETIEGEEAEEGSGSVRDSGLAAAQAAGHGLRPGDR